jgi:hypothetical protein
VFEYYSLLCNLLWRTKWTLLLLSLRQSRQCLNVSHIATVICDYGKTVFILLWSAHCYNNNEIMDIGVGYDVFGVEHA